MPLKGHTSPSWASAVTAEPQPLPCAHILFAPHSTPVQVVGALLDAEADDTFINNLILSVRSLIPVEALVSEVEKRNKLKMLNPFLEQLVSEGSKVRCCVLVPWCATRWSGSSSTLLLDSPTPKHSPNRLPYYLSAGPPGAQRPGQDHHRHQQQPGALPHHQPLLRLAGALGESGVVAGWVAWEAAPGGNRAGEKEHLLGISVM